MGLSALPGFLPRLMKKYPGLDISLRHDLSRRIAAGVIGMEIDIGIAVNPVRHPDLVIRSLCPDEFTLWTGVGDDCPKTGFNLICNPDLAQVQLLMKKLDRAGLKFGRVITSGSLEVAAQLAAEGGGLALLPAQVAKRHGRKLKPVPGAPVIYDDHCLLFRAENKGIRAIRAIGDAIIASFGKS